MALDITAEVEIARPAEDVARFASDPSHDPEWIGGVVEAEQLDAGPIAPGTKVRRVAKFLGRRIDYTTEVTEWRPPGLLVMSTTMPFAMNVRYEFNPNGNGGTSVRINVSGDATGFYKLAAPLMARQVKRSVQGDLERLKKLLE